MTDSNNDVHTEQDTVSLQIRIRELEKEIVRLHTQIKEQRYGLTWLDVPEAFETESENKIPILEEVKEKAIDKGGDTSPHIIIEGDNYHALTCLNYTHRGKIDVIYIDPPYNTGSDGFTYKDKRFLKEFPDGSPVPKEHPLRHSYWLSFMSKRLELAKNLLSDKGVIFISIDDNEQANLKLLCDKVFGEENFVAQVMWHKNYASANDSKTFSNVLDYILVYRKSENFLRNLLPRTEKQNHLYKYDSQDGKGLWRPDNLSVRTYSANYDYPIINPNTGTIYNPPKGRSWMTNKEKVEEWIKESRVYFGLNGKGAPQLKRYLSEVQKGVVPTTYWNYEDCGHNDEARREIKMIFGHPPFDSPKPSKLIMQILQIASSSKSSTILDFFAGSGTTLHATMKLNAEDGGHRQCILVQQREGDNNICENVTYERNRRVICGYTNAKGEQVEGLGGRLKYYRTNFVGKNASRKAIDADCVELARKAGYLLALGENTLEEIAHTDTYQIFADTCRDDVHIVSESNSMASCYTAIFFTENYAKIPEFVSEIEKLQASEPPQINVYIFCWGTPDIFESEFDNLQGIALKAIPQPILEVYKSINQ
ncbi:MAG: site-specific DNA-methyltransferase [Paludibacteraceae bacterium]|nr:site-specific DNA-methyltransferase [Paludibacteraceae bacterium]